MISKFINSLVTLKNKMFRLNENTNIKFMMGRICIFLLLFLIIPLNINALSSFQKVRHYYDRNDKINYDLTALNYKNFVYHYGVRKISGSITNKEEYKVKVITTVNFYDKNKNRLLEYPFEIEIEAMETNKFELKIDDSVSNDILNKVEYYCLESYDIIKPAEIVDLYNNYKFVKYDVKVNVNKNKTLDITKNMTSYFHKGKYGINYDIPLENKILRDDSTYTEDIVKIKNIEVNNVFTSFRKDKFLRIEIGSRNEYVKGNIDYEIKYNYDLGNDKMKDSDELYFNIIDTRDTSILNPTFTIIMPEEFDENELSFRDHSIGDGKDDNIDFTFNAI